MKTAKTSKRALLTSVLSIALCLSMLIGTTFAWFTDTASTAVNKIQAGTLDVDIVDADNNTLNGKTLYFRDKDQNTNILWEPGATFNLDTFRIVNKGNLALKYKVVISGIDGSAELLNVINFTVKKGEAAPVELAGWEGVLLPEGAAPAGGADVEKTAVIAISGKMDEQAGNQYQGLSIDGLGITVYATQYTYESDSKDNTYDAGADMTPDNLEQRVQGSAEVKANADTIVTTKDASASAVIPAGALTADTTVTLSKTPVATSGNITVDAAQSAATYEISLTDSDGNKLTAAEGKHFTVTLNVGDNEVINFLHNGVPMTKCTTLSKVTGVDQYYYSKTKKTVTFTTDDFSPFTAIYRFGGGLGTKGAPYLISTAEQALDMENGKGYYKLMADIVVNNEIYLSSNTFVLDLNGHSIKLEYRDDVKPNNGSVLYIGGKKSSLTINDSSAEQTGAVIGSDKTYTNKVTSAVRAGNYGKLIINGGHFYGTSEGTSCIFVYTTMSSGSKATVTINGGRFETATPSNGTYYVLNHQDNATAGCTITVNGGSFRNYNPGVTEVDPVNDNTGKIVLGAGCTTSATVEGDTTWYTVSKAQ